jgi:hypothetical protein
MAFNVFDLDFEEGSTNLGGTAGKVYYVPASHVQSIPAPGADGVTIDQPIVLKSGKRWASVYMTRDTGAVMDKPVGEMDGRSYENELEFFHPKVRAEVIKLQQLFTNGGFIFVVKDGNGIQRLIGSIDHPAYSIDGGGNAGKAPKDRNGVSFKFSAACATPAPIYGSVISLAPAV